MTDINITTTRQIILDTETTGMNQVGNHYDGHKIIEIGGVEIIDRRLSGNNFHIYLKPDRLIDPEALNIHGITNEFLLDKPTFADIADKFINYIRGAELIIHNASFDIGFIDYEFSKLNRGIPKINSFCKITDSLALARKMFPGKRNSLDALSLRYGINKSKRNLHGALLDAYILANIYLIMTSGQSSMLFNIENDNSYHPQKQKTNIRRFNRQRANKGLRVIFANDEEYIQHESHLDLIQKKSGSCLWRT